MSRNLPPNSPRSSSRSSSRNSSRSSPHNSPRRSATWRRLVFLAGFSVYFGVLWTLWNQPIIYPFKIFVVFLHEISHGLMALATGGTIERITLSPLEGGACHCGGGNAFLILSAGYLGSLVWGLALLEAAARAGRHTGRIVQGLGAGVLILTLLYVRGAFGIVFGLIFGSGLVFAAARLPSEWNRTLLNVLGLTSALYAILDIKSDVLDRPELRSDAAMLAELTEVPTLFWGLLWSAIALGLSGWMLLRAYRKA